MALEQWLVDGQKTIDLERIRRVTANLIGGSIAVLAHADPQTRVEVSRTSVRNLKVAVDGDTLIIDHPQLAWNDVQTSAKTLWNRPEAELSILVPAHVDVEIKAASAEVLVVGIDGKVTVSSAAGEQFIDGTTGDLHLNTVDAEISVRDHAGAVTTKTVAGDVTVAGEITSFAGSTISGATVLDVTSGLPDRIKNRSVTGTTTVRIPVGVTPDYRVSTMTAEAHLEGEPQQPTRGSTYRSPEQPYANRLTEIALETIAGRITVVRTQRGEVTAGSGAADSAQAPAGVAGAAFGANGQTDASGQVGGDGTSQRPAGGKVFRRIVKPDFDSRIDERVGAASDTLGVEPDTTADASGTATADSSPSAPTSAEASAPAGFDAAPSTSTGSPTSNATDAPAQASASGAEASPTGDRAEDGPQHAADGPQHAAEGPAGHDDEPRNDGGQTEGEARA